MATALANVSDDWVQRAFAAELDGSTGKGVGGVKLRGSASEMLGSFGAKNVIVIFLALCALNIICVVATPKYNGKNPKNTSHLGRFMIVMSILEIVIFAGSSVKMFLQIGEAENAQILYGIHWMMFASVSCGLIIAILLKEQRLTRVNDRFFNALRIIFTTVIFLVMVWCFPEFYENSTAQMALTVVILLTFSFIVSVGSLPHSKNKTAIGLLSFFAVLFYVIMAAYVIVGVQS